MNESSISIELNVSCDVFPIDTQRITQAIRTVLVGEGVQNAEISAAVLDDSRIRLLNRQHLNHDYATDVLSFLFSEEEGVVDAELLVSADTAQRQAMEYNWTAHDELLLYFVHGTLHLVGYDDREPADRDQMRERECHYLEKVGVSLPDTFPRDSGAEEDGSTLPSAGYHEEPLA